MCYQSHHLWNWNPRTTPRQIPQISLSIAPSLELKHSLPVWLRFVRSSINRTISGIETRDLAFRRRMDVALSIAPSLELKLEKSNAEMVFTIYQSHHLWNWNYLQLIMRLFSIMLSIAPSLELKRAIQASSIWCTTVYQSHHLWNWNSIPAASV